MQPIYDRIALRSAELKSHPFFAELSNLPAKEVSEKLRVWAPIFIHLSMTFRDINSLYYAYPQPSSDFESEISKHAKEDTTHWHYLVEDLNNISVPGFTSYEDVLSRIWSEENAPARHYIYSILNRAVSSRPSPFLRAASLEAGEATAKLFFGAASSIAKKYESLTGKALKYFSAFHVDLEERTAVDAPLFATVKLDSETLDRALSIVDAHFDDFKSFLNFQYSVTFPKSVKSPELASV